MWDGSQVTQWLHSGANTFDWWAFHDTVVTNQYYFFAWDTGNLNDPTRAALYTGSIGAPAAVGDISVSAVAQVPEPATLTLLGLALAGLGFARRRKLG
jgi:hypothetical protein